MNNVDLLPAGLYLAHLIDCGLHDAPAEPLPEGVTWERVHALAAYNSVEGMAFFGAKTRDDMPDDLRKQWEGEAQMTLFRRLRFDAERESIFAALAAEGLSYLPMKGALLVGYYPRPEMRSMADNDFLYGFVEPAPEGGFRTCGATEEERAVTIERGVRTIERVMRGRGYTVKSLRSGNHETFEKEPIFNFEPHRRLMSPSSPLAAYYDNPWARAVRDEADPHLLRFSDEDEYIYVLAHAFKHFDAAGSGIRFVVDVRVLLDAKGMGMNWDYVFAELVRVGLFEFEAQVRGLADAAFGGACTVRPLTPEQEELLCYVLGSGTYGNNAQAVQRRLDKQLASHAGDARAAKRGYVWERLTNTEALDFLFPRASKIAPLRPALQVARYVRGFARNPKKILGELNQVRKAK